MLDWIVWNPIEAGVIGVIVSTIYFSVIAHYEKKIKLDKERKLTTEPLEDDEFAEWEKVTVEEENPLNGSYDVHRLKHG